MKRFCSLFGGFFILLTLTGCTAPSMFMGVFNAAALQVSSNPKAEVFVNGKSIGFTPITSRKLKAGTYTVSLQTPNANWVEQVVLQDSTLTIINRTLTGNGTSTGYTAALENGTGVAVIGNPPNSKVVLDGQPIGEIPVYKEQVSVGSHDLLVTNSVYAPLGLKLKVTEGYKLVLTVDLGKPTALGDAPPTPLATTPPVQTLAPTQKPLVTPTAKPATPSTQSLSGTLTVGNTGTGWLRVRSQASGASSEIFRINTGDQVTALETSSGWTKIKTTDGKEGWVSSAFLVK